MRYPGWLVGALAVALLASSACGGGAGDESADRPDGETGRASSTSREEAKRAERERTETIESTVLATSSGTEVLFPVHNSPVPAIPGPSGQLVLDGAGCLRLAIPPDSKYDPGLSGKSLTLLWPRSYSARFGRGDSLLILDSFLAEGEQIVAREGTEVKLSSGYTESRGELAENWSVSEGTKHKVFERCPGLYHLTGGFDTLRKDSQP